LVSGYCDSGEWDGRGLWGGGEGGGCIFWPNYLSFV